MSRMQRLHIPENIDPPLDLCIQLRVPSDPEHLSILYGLIEWATIWSNWDRDEAHSGTELAWLYERILATVTVCKPAPPAFGSIGDFPDMLIRQNTDNPCLVEYSANGIDWCLLFDISLCQNFGTQPAPPNSEPPPPPGDTQSTCAKLSASGHLLIPAMVNAGDVITIESAAGAGWDGGEVSIGPIWRLPTGNVYFGGLDVGQPTVQSTDPAPTANHMSLIAAIGGTPVYLPLVIGGDATVPSGVSNAQVLIQVNDSDISNNQGDYQVCVKVRNNQPAAWTHTSNFALSPDGWVPHNAGSGDQAIWQAGVGWVPNPAVNKGVCTIQHPIAGTLTAASAILHDTATPNPSGGVAIEDGSTNTSLVIHAPIPSAGDNLISWSGSFNVAGVIELVGVDDSTTLTLTWKTATLSGTGTNPF